MNPKTKINKQKKIQKFNLLDNPIEWKIIDSLVLTYK